MEGVDGRGSSRGLRIVSIVALLLLAVQFSSGVVMASMGLPSATLSLLNGVFEAYGVVLAFALIGSIALLLKALAGSLRRPLVLAILAIQGGALAVWLASESSLAPPPVKANFPILAAFAIASTAGLCPLFFADRRRLMDTWSGWAHLLVLALVAGVFALRTAASLGLGMSPGPTGTLQGDWLLVNGPTILLESFAIGMWLSLLWDPGSRGLQDRWRAWLPMAALIPAVMGIFASGLLAFVFSAFITWGTNLAVFVPVTVSLSIAAASIACYVSFFLLLRGRGGDRGSWLLLGTASILLSGFYPSIVSESGLVYGLLLTTFALAVEPPRSAT